MKNYLKSNYYHTAKHSLRNQGFIGMLARYSTLGVRNSPLHYCSSGSP